MKKITFILILLAAAFSLKAQDVTGDWYGALNISGTQLRLVFHINKSGEVYATTFDSPDQGANGLGVDKTTVTGNAVTISSNTFSFTYNGIYKPDSAIIRGTFAQGPGSFPLLLTRKPANSKQGSIRRPQVPAGFIYKQVDVALPNSNIVLHRPARRSASMSGAF
jgi:hypothetical protein